MGYTNTLGKHCDGFLHIMPDQKYVSGCLSTIMMVQTAQNWHGHNITVFRGIHCPRYRTVFIQTDVRSSRVVVAVEVLFENSNEMSFVKDDAVVDALPAKTADRSFAIRILPWAFPGCDHFLDPHRLQSFSEVSAENAVSIAQ